MRYLITRILFPLLLLHGSFAFADQELAQLKTEKAGALHLKVIEKSGHTNVHLELGPVRANQFSVFRLESPARLVIDLAGKIVAPKKMVAIRKNQIINSIRIGTHPDKVRVVIDLAQDSGIEYRTETRADSLLIQLTTGANTSQTAVSPEPPASTPTPKSVPTIITVAKATPTPPAPTPSPTLEAKISPAPALSPTTIPVVTNTPQAISATVSSTAQLRSSAESSSSSSSALIQSLNAINFEYLAPDKKPMISLKLAKRPQFILSRKDERSYRLVIPECQLASPNLHLPLFPPQDYVGFAMIQANAQGNKVEVTIGVDRGSRISAVTRDNEIVVTTTN